MEKADEVWVLGWIGERFVDVGQVLGLEALKTHKSQEAAAPGDSPDDFGFPMGKGIKLADIPNV